MYSLQELSDKAYWNDFITNNFSFYSFLSSRERGELNQTLGHQVWRLGIFNKDHICVGVIQCIKHCAKRGSYLLCPHSPLILGDYFAVLSSLKSSLQHFAREHGAWFVRINGVTLNTRRALDDYKHLGFVFSPIHAHAEETNLLDLQLPESELLSHMRKTTRYVIKRAYKEGVEVCRDNSQGSIDGFIALHQAHAMRTDGKLQYVPFSPSFIHNLFVIFPSDNISCFNAYYKGRLEASVVSIIFGRKAVYYLGVSDIQNPQFSPAYVCQREAIKYAKTHGCDSYNFWGVCPDDHKKHPLYGPSLFKRGFGGRDYYLTHAHDLVCSWKYRFTYVVETIRKRKRGYYYIKPKT